MLALKLKRICELRGLTISQTPHGPFVVCDNGNGQGAFLESWDESKLGPRPTEQEIAAVDETALLATVEAEKAEEELDRIFGKVARRKYAEVVRHVKALEAAASKQGFKPEEWE